MLAMPFWQGGMTNLFLLILNFTNISALISVAPVDATELRVQLTRELNRHSSKIDREKKNSMSDGRQSNQISILSPPLCGRLLTSRHSIVLIVISARPMKKNDVDSKHTRACSRWFINVAINQSQSIMQIICVNQVTW